VYVRFDLQRQQICALLRVNGKCPKSLSAEIYSFFGRVSAEEKAVRMVSRRGAICNWKEE
jgi:hypothetical protein